MHLGIRRPSLSLPIRQLSIAVLVVVLGLVTLSFARILFIEYQLNLQKHALETDVVELKQQNEQLRAQIDYLQTDAAIEKLAREELGWTKPGETAVIVDKSDSSPSPASSTRTAPAPAQREDWHRWLSWILDQIGRDR